MSTRTGKPVPPLGGMGPSIAAEQHMENDNQAVMSPWMNADVAFVYLGFPTRKALYQAVRRGLIPVHRVGNRRMRFHRAELDKVLLNRR